MARPSLIAVVTVAVAAVGVLVALVWQRPIEPIVPPLRTSFDASRIERGARLAALGNCAGCHSTPEGRPYAGGVPLATPFGRIYGSNVTPDAATGIGRWSEAAFVRAMREGVARSGRHLYPAFPYEHFTRAGDGDLQDLYAFLMTRDPVEAPTPPHELRFPFGWRPLLAGWKWLFLDRRPWQPDPARDAAWNRGAYLVQSLAHCGSCHTPRNLLGAERRGDPFDGGEARGWYAPPLNARSPSPLPWTEAALAGYLRTGLAQDHAIAGGPMQEVVAGLAGADAADVQAIARYVVSLMAPASAAQQELAAARRERASRPLAARPGATASRATPPARAGGVDPAPAAGTDPAADAPMLALGAAVYAGACAACHDRGRGVSSAGALPMPLAVAVYDADPRSLLRIVREGIEPMEGRRGRWMPAFGAALTDAQLEALAAYLRRHAAHAPPWPGLARAVRDTRPGAAP
jgi:mono/diheme cytochrome c family protein